MMVSRTYEFLEAIFEIMHGKLTYFLGYSSICFPRVLNDILSLNKHLFIC